MFVVFQMAGLDFFLSNWQQYVSINSYVSGLTKLNCGVPQGSVLEPLLFLLYINDLNQAIKNYVESITL